MSFSVISKFSLVTVFLLATVFLFSAFYTNAKTISSSSGCAINLGLSTCKVVGSTASNNVKGLFDFYDAKFGLTAAKVLTPSEVIAQTLAKLDLLTATLVTIKSTVINSKTLTETEKLNFLKQIEIINAQILKLKKSLDPKSESQGKFGDDYSVPTPPVPEEDKESAKSADLESILVTFNNANDEAKVSLKYKNTTKTKYLTLESVAAVSDFYAKMKALKEGLTIELSNSEKIFAEDIKKLIRISARNPVRETDISPGSAVANKLYQNFALQSIINTIVVKPGDSINSIPASVELLTDQDESVKIYLTEDPNGRYLIQILYFAITPHDVYTIDPDNGRKLTSPKFTEYASDITREEIEETVQDYFEELDFSKGISNFGKKFAKFIINNQAYFESSIDVQEKFKDCYQAGDKSIVNEFFGLLIEGIQFQSEPTDKISSYLVSRIKANPDFPDSFGCIMWVPAF